MELADEAGAESSSLLPEATAASLPALGDSERGGGGRAEREDTHGPPAAAAAAAAANGSAAVVAGFDNVELLDGVETSSEVLDTSRGGRPAPERRSQWWHVAFLLIADTVGTGVLELPGNVRKLGWAPGLTLIVLFFPVNLYTGWLLSRLSRRHPQALSYGELASASAGRRWAKITHAFMATYFCSVLGGYVLVLAESVQGLVSSMCLFPASLLSGLILLGPVQLRSLHSLAGLSVISALTIAAAVTICLWELGAGRGVGVQAAGAEQGGDAVAPEDDAAAVDGPVWFADSSFVDKFTAVTGIVFAYAGQSVFLEMISEMVTPAHFPRALLAAGPFMVGIYLLVSVVGYGNLGAATPANIMESLAPGHAKTFANMLMLVHMVISYLITSQVLSRFVHTRVAPTTADEHGARGKLHWALISGGVLVWSIFVSNGLPFFDDLTGIIGALLASNISYGLPSLFALASATRGALELIKHERLLMAALLLLTVVLVVLGLYTNIRHTIADSREWGAPFSCHSAEEG